MKLYIAIEEYETHLDAEVSMCDTYVLGVFSTLELAKAQPFATSVLEVVLDSPFETKEHL